MPKIPYTCFNRVGKDYLSGKAICTETTVTTVMYAEKDCNGKTIVPPNGGPSYYPRGACTKVKDQSFGPGDWFVLATCPNYPPSEPPTPTTYDCPTDFPFKFATGCPIGSWNSKAGKGCYKQQSQVKGCSGAAGSWCVFSAYKDDTTTMKDGSLKEQLANGFGTVCGASSEPPTPITYDCPIAFPFKFGTGCPIGNWDKNSKAGKGCYKQQSQVKGCSGAAGSWCVFSAYKDDTTTMYGGSLKDQLAQGFGTVCPSETTAVTPKCGPNEQIPCFDNGADLSVFKTSDCSGKS